MDRVRRIAAHLLPGSSSTKVCCRARTRGHEGARTRGVGVASGVQHTQCFLLPLSRSLLSTPTQTQWGYKGQQHDEESRATDNTPQPSPSHSAQHSQRSRSSAPRAASGSRSRCSSRRPLWSASSASTTSPTPPASPPTSPTSAPPPASAASPGRRSSGRRSPAATSSSSPRACPASPG